jgi:hypothetical protein
MTDDDEIIDAEIVDDSQPGPSRLVPADTILIPCHHGCTCGLHQQTVYGERVPEHPPSDLDHGEMALLVEAADHATRLLNDFHEYFRKLRTVATRTHGQACHTLRELTVLLGSDAAERARAERDRVEAAYADLTAAERQPAPRWLKATAVAAVLGIAIFDAYFFQQTFLNILQVAVGDPWWKQDIGLVAALVLAFGLVAAGRVLAGPIWRMGLRWRRIGSPDDQPSRRVVRVARVLAIGAAPAATFFVLGWWASVRGQAAADAESAIVSDASVPPLIPNGLSVMLLLLSLALTVIVLEVLTYNPYQADMRRAERAVAKLRKQVTAGTDAVTEALDTHEIAWRDLRSARDEVISFVQAELARPWQTVILPARLRHGKAGPTPVGPKCEVKIEMPTVIAVNGDLAGADRVTISYQVFEGVTQPQPGPGPLAEVVRAVLDLSPDRLRIQQRHLERAVHAQLGGVGEPGEAEETAEADQDQAPPGDADGDRLNDDNQRSGR